MALSMPLLLLPLLIGLLLVVLIPLGLYWQFRKGTSRRQARRWVATLNLIAVSISTVMFLIGAVVTSVWIPGARTFALYGLVGGAALGAAALALTRWEHIGGIPHFTPNRWLLLVVTLIVAVRVGYGVVRMLAASVGGGGALAPTAGATIRGSMAAGAVVLGYFLVYWIGIRRRTTRQLAR
jgi:hypothetical protein